MSLLLKEVCRTSIQLCMFHNYDIVNDVNYNYITLQFIAKPSEVYVINRLVEIYLGRVAFVAAKSIMSCQLRLLEYGSVLHTFWECCVQRSYFCVDTKTLFKQCLISAIMNTSWYFTVFLTTPRCLRVSQNEG